MRLKNVFRDATIYIEHVKRKTVTAIGVIICLEKARTYLVWFILYNFNMGEIEVLVDITS